MAINVNEFAKAIRISVEDPTGTALTDATRLLAYCNAAIDRHAPGVPDAIKDVAIVQLGQYLYDAPVAEQTRPQSALANSGVRAMLAPYRVHRAGVDVQAVSDATGIDRDAVIAIVNSLLPDWVSEEGTPIPAGKLVNAPGGTGGGLTVTQVQALIDGDPKIASLEDFEDALRRDDSVVERGLVNVAISNAAYLLSGNPSWPAARTDRNITISVYPYPTGTVATHTFPLSSVLALASVSVAQQLVAGNTISFQPSDRSATYRVAHNNNRIIFTSDDVGSYYLTITDSEIDLEDFARLSSADMVPVAKLPSASGSAAGIIQPAEYALIHAAIDAEHLHDVPVLSNALLEATDALMLDDASVADGAGSQLKRILISELDKRYRASSAVPASDVSVSASGFDGNLAPADDTVQKALQKFDDFTVPSRTGGLNQAAVDARVNALVPSWARMSQRFTDEQQAVFDAFTGDDVWTDSTDIQVATTVVSSVPVSNFGSLSFVAAQEISPRQVNQYVIMRVPNAKVPNVAKGLLRLAVTNSEGLFDSETSDGWTLNANSADTANTYYYVQVADLPVGVTIKVEEFQPTIINADRVSNFFIPARWARQGSGIRIPQSKVPIINTLTTTRLFGTHGIAIADVTSNHRNAASRFNPSLTVTSSEHGLLTGILDFRVHSGSTSQLALGAGTTRFTFNVAYHEIVALTAFVGREAITSSNAVKLGEVDIYNVTAGARGTTKYGTVSFYLVRDTNGVVAWLLDYVNDSSGVVGAGTVQVAVDIFSIPSGAPAAGASARPARVVTEIASFTWPSDSSTYNLTAQQRTNLVNALMDSEVTHLTYELTEATGEINVSIVPFPEVFRTNVVGIFNAPIAVDIATDGMLKVTITATAASMERLNGAGTGYRFADACVIRSVKG